MRKYLNISIIICYHRQTKHKDLLKTINSILFQKNIPNQIIIIKNGLSSTKNSNYLKTLKKNNLFKILKFEKNNGLAVALNLGISNASNELIARIDPGEEVINNRFFIQNNFMNFNKEISILGSYALENYKNRIKILKKPTTNKEIYLNLKSQNPLIHSSVIFRKKQIQKIGGYPNIYKCQDFFLWVKCMEKELKFQNIAVPLIKSELNKEMMIRRDYKYFTFEKKVFDYMLNKNIINKFEYSISLMNRFMLRTAPIFLKIILYKLR